MISKFQPTTSLEKDFESLLSEYRMNEKRVKEKEGLEMSNMSLEEARARREHMQKFRSLMFFEELRFIPRY